MVKKFLNKIAQKPEGQKEAWAVGMSTAFTVLILVGFGFYKGFFSMKLPGTTGGGQVAAVVTAKDAPSPVESTTETFKASFKEIQQKYNELKDSLSSVLVPFVSGIDIYERK